MKRIISILASMAMVMSWTVKAQSRGESVVTEEVQASAQAGNNQNRQTVGAQRNQNGSGAVTVGQGGSVGRLGGGYGGYGYRFHNVASRYPATGEKPLVVRSSDMSLKDEANLEEDLAVMAHLLDKALEDLPAGQARTRTAMGIDVFAAPNAGTIRSLYLERYGALFLLNVGFPVVAPASSTQEEKPTGDSTWEEARQELYGQSEPQTLVAQGEEFSQEKVTRLKEGLLRALKNATNIRGLEGDVTVCVMGGANTLGAKTAGFYGQSGSTGAQVNQLLVANTGPGPSQGTVLTIKVNKAVVDAFAKGELKFADLEKRARIAVYTTAATSDPFGVNVFSSGEAGVKR